MGSPSVDKQPPQDYYPLIMASERLQRQVDRLLDYAAEAVAQGDWELVRDSSQKVLVVDPENQEALTFLAVAPSMP